MYLLEVLEAKCSKSNEPAICGLLMLYRELEPLVEQHLAQITTQLPEYDIHDISHSRKMILNIEKLLTEEQMQALNACELFLLLASCLLHDAGMALPAWEYDLLRSCEGQEDFVDPCVHVSFALDGAKPPSETEMKARIKKNKDRFYQYDEAKTFIFTLETEEAMLADLAKRAVAYVDYRNGFDGLKEKKEAGDLQGYLKESADIRCGFIRETHHLRVVEYVYALRSLFEQTLGGPWGKRLANDLADICRSHGEDFHFVMELSQDKNRGRYTSGHRANLAFICSMLRLSDILHFSYDRSPISLFAEKRILDATARKHWKAKQEGVNYSILRSQENNNEITIEFNAYCDTPETYYFLRDYIRGIEGEIQNYYKFQRENQQPQYSLNLKYDVDYSGLGYDSNEFTPNDNLHFSLDQRRILELLMGVNLYKDKYLCLRELYQNALDACRVMRGFYPEKEGQIEFGMGTDAKKRRYVYCLDNGSGMNEGIIFNHFLKIGNSFYNSKAFLRQNASARQRFEPVSQFGIGVLSCFMLGDELDITTRYHKDADNIIRFIVNGPCDHFYFKKPEQEDLDERLTGHGTLVKIFLKDEEPLTNEALTDEELMQWFYEQRYMFKFDLREDGYRNNLRIIMQHHIACVPAGVRLLIDDSKRTCELWSTSLLIERFFNSGYEKVVKYNDIYRTEYLVLHSDVIETLQVDEIVAEHAGINYSSIVVTPNRPHNIISLGYISYYGIISPIVVFSRPYLNDGIYIKLDDDNVYSETGYIIPDGAACFNFTSRSLLNVSVDRAFIVSLSSYTQEALHSLLRIAAKKEIDRIWNRITEARIAWNSDIANNIWECYFNQFKWNIASIIEAIRESNAKVFSKDLCEILGDQRTMKEIFNSQILHFPISAYRSRSNAIDWLFEILALAASTADISDTSLDMVLGNKKNWKPPCLPTVNKKIHNALKRGDYCNTAYAEYDFANQFFPFIAHDLFNRHQYTISVLGGKSDVTIDDNTLLISISPFPHELSSLYHDLSSRGVFRDRGVSSVYRNSIELGVRGEKLELVCPRLKYSESNANEDSLIFIYLAPEPLSYTDKIDLEYYSSADPYYAKGVICGWSILCLGWNGIIVEPGIAKKSTLLKRIPDYFWETYSDTEFYFPDGTRVTKEYIDSLED